MTSWKDLFEDIRASILKRTDDDTIWMFRCVSPRCKHDAELATVLAQQESARFVSAHAIELVPLLKTIVSVYGGWVSTNLRLIALQSAVQAHCFFLLQIASPDAHPCVVLGREHSFVAVIRDPPSPG